MSLIGMFETFFFMSLAITFILIVFLVYHFKHRITSVEHKCDTMFEIINNIVSEMNNGRTECHVNQGGLQMHDTIPERNDRITINFSDDDGDGESEDESETNTDSEGESESDNEEDSESNNEDDESENDNEDDENENEEMSESGNSNMRVININNVQDMDTIETNYDNDNDIPIDNVDEINDTDIVPLDSNNLDIHVEKLDINANNLEESSIASSITESKSINSVYKKMTLPLLKAYVIEKGLISDPSKMKKQELINLIETNNI
jgi:hypothetical protein